MGSTRASLWNGALLLTLWPVGLALVGCRGGSSSGAAGGEANTSGASQSRVATAPGGAAPSAGASQATAGGGEIDVCKLMPLPDVAAILAPALALRRKVEAPYSKGSYQACTYTFPKDPWVSAVVEIPDWGSPQQARGAYQAEHQNMFARTDVLSHQADVKGFGDDAFVDDEYGTFSAMITVLAGSRTVRVVVGHVDEQPFEFRIDLAEKLAREVLKRLH